MKVSWFRNHIFAVLIAATLSVFSASAFAADTTARIKGTVTDPTGAVITGATVTATNLATGVSFSVTSTKDGGYFFGALPIGTYEVKATASGFKTFDAKGIVLAIDQEYVEPVKLQLGSTSEVLEVAADAVQVNTTDMQLDNVVTAQQMQDLPLIGRGFTSLEQLEPGIQASSDRFGGYSADGAQTQQSSFLIDGADTNDLALNTVTFSPNLDAIEEFNLITGPLNAEYDRNSGGIVSATIKRGTNRFHGDAFEFYRDTFLNTGNYFSYVPASGTKAGYKNVTPYHQNIYGGTIGGPVLKDRLFFFGAYQGTHQRVPGTGGSSNVFTPAQLTGDFSTSLAGTNPAGYSISAANTNPIPGTITSLAATNAACAPGDPWGPCLAALGGKIPASAINPISSALLSKYVPAANSGINYVFNSVSSTSANQYIGRLDYAPNSKNVIYGTYIYQKSSVNAVIPFTGASLPGFGEIDTTNVYQYTLDYTRQLSSTAVNDFAVHYTRFNYQAVFPQTTAAPSSFGFSIAPQDTAAESLPTINTGYFTLGFSTNGPQPRIDQVYQIDDGFSKVVGNHVLKMGYDGRKMNVSNPFSANNSGSYGFSDSGTYSTGDPGLDFLLGNSNTYAQGTGATIQAEAFLNYLYVQDTWKATSALTLDYGLGYQIDTPLHNEQYGGEAVACLVPGETSTVFPNSPTGIVYPGDKGCSNSGQAYTRFGDFGPRFGFAWAPNLGWLSAGDSKKLAIRGGFGIYYNRTEEETSLNNLETPPFGLSSQGAVDYGASAPAFANPYQDIDTGTVYTNKFPYTFPKKGQTIDYSEFEPLSISTYSPRFRSPYAENFQLSLERELPSRLIARLTYVGSLAHHNQITYEGNPETAAGHAACLAATTTCGALNSNGNTYRTYQSYYFSGNTQFGYVDPVTGTPAFPSVGEVASEGSSNYNSLQASLLKNTTHGLQFQISYTYAHAMDDGSNYENSGYGGSARGYNQFQPSLNYGDSTYDARQRLVIAPTYTVPLLHQFGTYSWQNLALAGWQVTDITTLATGFPFDISYGGGAANSAWCSPGFSFYACPDEPQQTGPLVRAANPRTKAVSGTVTQNYTVWFQQTGFAEAPLGQFGNTHRDEYHGPGINNSNMVLAKNFNLRQDGSLRLQLRMESDNVFNHTQFSNPGVGFGTSTTQSAPNTGTLLYGSAGHITAAAASRLTQLAAKIYF